LEEFILLALDEFEETRDFLFKSYMLIVNGAKKELIEKFAKAYFPEIEVAEEIERKKLIEMFEALKDLKLDHNSS